YNHADTLYASVKSIQHQTVQDFELFIIGDGVPDRTREIVAELTEDPRIRFFDYPKGRRTGEPYRHEVLRQALGTIVSYLSDDDLFFPNHLEYMLALLQDADFANALPFLYDNREFSIYSIDLSQEENHSAIAQGNIGRFGLSFMSHTLEFYRRLPHGWRETPDGIPTDQYMFRQCLSVPDCKAVSGFKPTVLRFPADSRLAMT